MEKIGVIGQGFVGTAVKEGMKKHQKPLLLTLEKKKPKRL